MPVDETPLVVRQTFDSGAAHAAVASIPLSACTTPRGPFGPGHADVFFTPETGSVLRVMVAAPFASGLTGMCVRSALMNARVAPFVGPARSVARNLVIAP